MAYLQQETSLIQQWNPYRECGILSRISGTLMEAQGLAACLGELCHIPSFRSSPVLAEVIDLHHQTTILLALTPVHDLALGTEVIPLRRPASLPLSNHLLGRVIDGFGNPLDGNPHSLKPLFLHYSLLPPLLCPVLLYKKSSLQESGQLMPCLP